MKDLPIATTERVYLPETTLGSWYFQGEYLVKTMELPWLNNKRGVSCIPEGDYLVTKEPPIPKDDPKTPEDESGGRKPRNYWHFRFHNVPGRSGILVHKITFVKDLQGCIGVGLAFVDINKDDVYDMAESSKALQKLVDVMPDKFILRITKKK